MSKEFDAWYFGMFPLEREMINAGSASSARNREQYLRCWKASRESLPSLFTALDMSTAAAQGFRDGAAKLKEAYRAGWDASGEGWNAEYPCDGHEKPRWVADRNRALEEIMQQVKP